MLEVSLIMWNCHWNITSTPFKIVLVPLPSLHVLKGWACQSIYPRVTTDLSLSVCALSENKIDDLQSNPTGGAINDFRQNNPGTIASAITGIASEIDLKMVEDQIKRFGESSKILMSALDEVAKVHPFIGGACRPFPFSLSTFDTALTDVRFCLKWAVAVLAFKAVVTLELKRKSNSKKIVTLDLQMSDMVSILLEQVPDPLYDCTSLQR